MSKSNIKKPQVVTEQQIQQRIPLDKVAVVVLAGGKGERLFPLTKNRCKPAMPFGGRYNLIDVPISHSLSTGLTNIFVIAQYLGYTLQRHLGETYSSHGPNGHRVQVLMPEEREGHKVWYKGTADAVRQNLHYFSEVSADYFLILSGDQLYNINFEEMIAFHLANQAGMTIAAKPVQEREAKRMGLLKVDHTSLALTGFHEKPQDFHVLQQYYTDDVSLKKMGYNPTAGHNFLGSMGIYLFNRDVLFNLLEQDQREDFGKHLISTQMKQKDVRVYCYGGYWEDIGTIESFYKANLALTDQCENSNDGLVCHDEHACIHSAPQALPGVKLSNTRVSRSLICEGTVCEGDEITHSVIGVRSVIGKNTKIQESILMGNEFYERDFGGQKLKPHIGKDCHIKRAIIDENVQIGDGVKLVNDKNLTSYDPPDNAVSIYVRDGIIIVPRGTEIPDNFTF